MNSRRPFYRKLIYLGIMVGLLLPMAYISRPAGGGVGGRAPGGVLARLRTENGLSQANLGEIDPASETIKLATLGMRGVAVNLLWERANHYQKTKNWSALNNTVRQIIHLQPNFVSVWVFQGWNLSYNVSAEWDDYRDRYHWVVEGIKFLLQGTRFNVDNTRLLSDIGRFTGHKIGRSDERRQFRRMFREDDDFPENGDRTAEERDNWLVGRDWYLRAEQAVARGAPVKGGSELMFYTSAPLWRINYAIDLEVDGGPDGRAVFGDNARRAWEGALGDWVAFGRRDVLATSGETIQLDTVAPLRKEIGRINSQLVALAGDLRMQVGEERHGALPPEEKKILIEQLRNPDPARQDEVNVIATKVYVPWADVIVQLEGDKRKQAEELNDRMLELAKLYARTDNYSNQINYENWLLRCTYESQPATVQARERIYLGELAHQIDADMVAAQKNYEAGFAQWRLVLDKYPELLSDGLMLSDLMEPIQRYQQVMVNGLGNEFPDPFVLKDVMDAYARAQVGSPMPGGVDMQEMMRNGGMPVIPGGAGPSPR